MSAIKVLKLSATAVIRAIPLNKLKKSPKNVRVKEHAQEEITALADNIHATRMLEMPTVEPELDAKGKPTGFYLVTIGEGRRRAQLLRVKRRQIKKDELIYCIEDTGSDPTTISLAENLLRSPMHPADQFVAFRTLIDKGKSVEDVAAEFSVSPLVVARRLKLANVHSSFLDQYREGAVKQEQLMALALTDDHERQQEVWNQLSERNRTPDAIRRMLTEHEISMNAPVARFVGLDAYIAAGGGVRRDLFSNDENGGFITDANLLTQLADAKLKQKADRIKKEGFAWVEAAPSLDYAELHTFGRVSNVAREPTTKEKKAQAVIAKRREKIEADVANAEAAHDDERVDDLTQQLDDLDAEESELREQQSVPDPEQQAAAGAFITIGQDGKFRVERGLLKPDDVKRFKKAKKSHASTEADEDSPRIHSESMVRRLTAHRTMALQAVLAQRPDVALVALAHRLIERTFFVYQTSSSVLKISTDPVQLKQHATDIEQSKAHGVLAGQRETWEGKLPRESDQLFAWLLEQPQSEVLALLAFCVAYSVNAVETREGESDADSLAQAVGLDMRDWWTPTPETYLSSVPKSRILAAVTEAVSAEEAGALGKLKKAPLAAAAAVKLANVRWLPEPLRMEVAA